MSNNISVCYTHSMIITPLEILGVVGMALILFAFYRVNSGKWTNKSLWYELDNLFGAGLLCVYSWQKTAYAVLALNAIWLIVALIGLRSIYDRHPRLKKAVSKTKR
mgnify:CR=1 FL=1